MKLSIYYFKLSSRTCYFILPFYPRRNNESQNPGVHLPCTFLKCLKQNPRWQKENIFSDQLMDIPLLSRKELFDEIGLKVFCR